MAALVSVIVPAFNAARFLRASLNSVLHQTYSPLEVIVVDDGSSDGTAELVTALARQDRRLSIHRQNRHGVAVARNLGLSHAQGEWVAPLDADDIWHREKIEKQVAAFAAGSIRQGLVYCWTRFINESGDPVGELRPSWSQSPFP